MRTLPLVWWLVACAEGEPVRLDDPWAWGPAFDEPESLATHRPAADDCPRAAWVVEATGFELQTGVCAYGSFEQPLVHRVRRGDRLRVEVWHADLDAAHPADAHLALWTDDRVVWEHHVAIPAVADVVEVEVVVEHDAEDVLGLHLHNHGFNSWTLGGIHLVPRRPL